MALMVLKIKDTTHLTRKHVSLLVCLVMVLVVIGLYWRVGHYEFTEFDDSVYVSENRHVQGGLTESGLRWAFQLGDKDKTYWHPLTWLSHMLDVQLYGFAPGQHHLTNVLIHILNTLLLYLLLYRMTGAVWRSAFVVALFAVHPINVESVAWVAERKNVLSTFFWMLSLLAYFLYTRRPGFFRYLPLLAVYVMGLLAKPMLVTLPFVLLLLDYWPLRRLQLPLFRREHRRTTARLFIEKAPLMALSALSILISSVSVRDAGNMISTESVPYTLRIANALVSYVTYIGKLIWPLNLAPYYPYPDSLSLLKIMSSALILILMSIIAWRSLKHHPYLAVGWLWFLGTLVPVSGLIQAGLWPALADRWAYLPSIGLFILAVWGAASLFRRNLYQTIGLSVVSGAVLIFCMTVTWLQVGYWEDDVRLFTHTLKVTGSTWLAHTNLANALGRRGNIDEAIHHYQLAIQSRPPNPEGAYYNLAIALDSQGKLDEAISNYSKALDLNPGFVSAHINLGTTLARQGRISEAMQHYDEAIRLQPDSAPARINIGNALLAEGKIDDAMGYYLEAVRLDSARVEAYNNLGLALIRKGRIEAAIGYFKLALKNSPGHKESQKNLALASAMNEKITAAAGQMRDALNFSSGDRTWDRSMARLLQTKKNLNRMLVQYRNSLQLQPGFSKTAIEEFAVVSEVKKDYEKKLPVIMKIIDIQPENAVAFYHAACIYARQGKAHKSVQSLKAAIRKGFNDWDLIRSDRDLDKIRGSAYYGSLPKNL